MNSLQYTVRNVPAKVDRVLRARAHKQGKSFNAALVEALEKGAGVAGRTKKNHDLAWFFGSGGIGTGEEAAFRAQRRIDQEKWSV